MNDNSKVFLLFNVKRCVVKIDFILHLIIINIQRSKKQEKAFLWLEKCAKKSRFFVAEKISFGKRYLFVCKTINEPLKVEKQAKKVQNLRFQRVKDKSLGAKTQAIRR